MTWLTNNLIAILALVLSCVALWGQNRRSVKIRIDPMVHATASSGGPSEEQSLLAVTVTNLGKTVTVAAPFVESEPKGTMLSTGYHLYSIATLLEVQFAEAAQFEPPVQSRRLDTGEAARWALDIAGKPGSGEETVRVRIVVPLSHGRSVRSKPFEHTVVGPPVPEPPRGWGPHGG
ncbi:MAG TPA: hypothetical protein VGC37_08645 [Friedmanniella sp.]